ncbi:MAG: acetylornithine/N-succinyldiaminopimelate aminotransferase [Flavobacteriales bacterium]|jgi:acetylornithine/N-succinyldiaminopimelate aminotransferase
MSESALMNTYGLRTTTIVKGEGAYLWDDQGRRYLDAISGIAVCGLGYSHPAVTKALCDQANTLIHCSNLYLIEPQKALGEALLNVSGMDKVFFGNSGAEANEAALKIARKYGGDKGIQNPEVITATQSFHGRTLATLSATGNSKIQAGFAPLLSGFVHVEYNSIAAINAAANANTVAIMVEPIQGEGGINIPATDYLNQLRELCDQNDWLLILDEIQTGNARTGKFFAYQHNGILPDVVTTAKGLGNGVPIGACLARGKAATVLLPGNHGSTFGGNPLAANTALAVVKEVEKPELQARVSELGHDILNGLREALSDLDYVSDIRGTGLLIGIELTKECTELVAQAKELGVLINVTNGKVIRLLPPFILSNEQAQEIVSTVSKLVREFH